MRQVLYPQGQSEEFRKVAAAVAAAADIPVALATTMYTAERSRTKHCPEEELSTPPSQNQQTIHQRHSGYHLGREHTRAQRASHATCAQP